MSSELRFWIRCPYFDDIETWIQENLSIFHDIGYHKNGDTLDIIVTLRDRKCLKILDSLKAKEIKELKNKEWSLLLKFAENHKEFKYIRSPIDSDKLTLKGEYGEKYTIFSTKEDEKTIDERIRKSKYRSSILNYAYCSLAQEEKYVLIFLSKNIGKDTVFKATEAVEKTPSVLKYKTLSDVA
jgi:hypothetical protein